MRRRGFLVAVPVAARFAASEVAEVLVVAVVVKSAAFALHQPQCEAATASDDGLNNFRNIRHHDISTKNDVLFSLLTGKKIM